VDKAIDVASAPFSSMINPRCHSLLADLYGENSLGNPMLQAEVGRKSKRKMPRLWAR